MKKYLVRRISTNAIEYAMSVDDTDLSFVGPSGPDAPAATIDVPCEPGCELIPYEGDSLLNAVHSPTAILRWNGVAPEWQEAASLDEQRARKVDEMSAACAAAILAGFVSSALGAVYTYPAKPTDQANLSGSVLASILPSAGADWSTPFWCADAAGAWDFRMHSAAQIQQVGVDAKVAILSCMTINQQLSGRIATSSVEQLATIVWPA